MLPRRAFTEDEDGDDDSFMTGADDDDIRARYRGDKPI